MKRYCSKVLNKILIRLERIYHRLLNRFKKIKSKLYFNTLSVIYQNKFQVTNIEYDKHLTLDIRAEKFFISMNQVRFRDFCTIRIRKNGRLVIGQNVFFNSQCSINCMDVIVIGDNTLFGENVKIYDHNHRFRDKTHLFSEQDYSLGNIQIGSRCWFGSNVVILKGVDIGDNVVVGAGCIISENIPANTIVKSSKQNQLIKAY